MRVLNKIMFLGLFLIAGYAIADKASTEQLKQEWLKKFKEHNYHLKNARKNARIGIKILKSDLDLSISGDARRLIKWTVSHYLDYLEEYKKIYS